MIKETENEGDVAQSSFDRAKEAMATVLAAYQEAKQTNGRLTPVDLYEFSPMMRIVLDMERENLEGALRGEELQRIEDTPEFKALAHSAAGAKAIKLSHIYDTRLVVLDELAGEGKDVAALRQAVLKDRKSNPDT